MGGRDECFLGGEARFAPNAGAKPGSCFGMCELIVRMRTWQVGVYLLRQGSEALFTGILAVVAGVPILWLLVSVSPVWV